MDLLEYTRECVVNQLHFVCIKTLKVNSFKGTFHQGHAAFKFVKVDEKNYEYNTLAMGCWEYSLQERIKVETKVELK